MKKLFTILFAVMLLSQVGFGQTHNELENLATNSNGDCALSASEVLINANTTVVGVLARLSDGADETTTTDCYRIPTGFGGTITFTSDVGVGIVLSVTSYHTAFCDDGGGVSQFSGWGTHTLNSAYYHVIFIQGGTSGYNAPYQYTISGATPVKLTSFTATKLTDAVQLNWTTATEVNNYGFEIESTLTPHSEQWDNIGFVGGHGNSNSPKDYSYTATNEASHFRLKQIDIDGGFEYSDVVTVASNVSFKLNQNHPNPFNPNTIINYEIGDTRFVSLNIYNTLGQEVATLVNKEQNAGRYQVEFNANSLPSGTYFYKLQSGEFSEVRKMLLIK